ncbi:MAG: redoxin domain-containing protein [Planctomycetaceae bacterium]|nr:redoxin domain-containing protein [Planctomycetaceae bacterium]
MRPKSFLLFAAGLLLSSRFVFAQPAPATEAYWTLLHEEAAVSDLGLTASQRDEYQAALDPLDLRLFPLRNRPVKEASEGAERIVADAKAAMTKILTPKQLARLEKLVLRQLGTRALKEDSVVKGLVLSDKQRAAIDSALADTQAAQAKLREAAADQSPEDLRREADKIQAAERTAILAALTDAQKQKWAALAAIDFDLAKLGRTRFKVPELVGDASAWRNSPPLSLSGQKGKVVVVHYFACGCINCIHNYPIYRKWHSELAGKDVTLIGIHTPETKPEHDIAHLERKIKEDELAFPLLIDNDGANWNAWGNNMWPSVYVIDKQGYLRHFWAGELKWQGAKGEEITRDWIDRLLKE